MTTKKNLVPMRIKIENNKVLCNKFGNDFLDLLGDLGWEYQRMGRSGRETYDEIMQMIGVIEEGEVYMEI
tara:strand:- start:603 stop:812 length:210 start_codon:yes stop_codon:yes gene_type:complete